MAVAMVLLGWAGAAAGQSRVRFDYTLDDSSKACPTGQELQAGVADALDTNPFDDEAEVSIVCRVSSDGTKLTADIATIDENGETIGKRQLESNDLSCTELASQMRIVITLSLARRMRAHQSDLLDVEPPAEPSPPPAPVKPPPEPTKNAPWQINGVVGIAAVATDQSDVYGGALVGASVGRGGALLGVEAELDTANAVDLPMGRVVSSAGAVHLLPCWRSRALVGCARLSAGWIRGRGEGLPVSRSATTPHFSLGTRAAWERALTDTFALRIHLDFAASVSETKLQVDETTVWTSPAAFTALGISILGRFL